MQKEPHQLMKDNDDPLPTYTQKRRKGKEGI